MIVGADDFIRQSDFPDQFHRGRLRGEKAVGPAFDHASCHMLGLNHAAQPRTRFDERGREPQPVPDNTRPTGRRCRLR